MNEKQFKIEFITRIQKIFWYVAFVYFALLGIMYYFNFSHTHLLAQAGVYFILAATIIKLFVIAEQFHSARLYRFWFLSYLLMFILFSTVLLKYLL
ncbi:MAG: hypothetical protein GXO93_00260 [FCB group bacterium]|nr:hypothetical protein [FCB group bacterium]